MPYRLEITLKVVLKNCCLFAWKKLQNWNLFWALFCVCQMLMSAQKALRSAVRSASAATSPDLSAVSVWRVSSSPAMDGPASVRACVWRHAPMWPIPFWTVFEFVPVSRAETERPVDHCQRGTHDCDAPERSRCSYTGDSSYICSCLPGFSGDGRACQGNQTHIKYRSNA